MADDDLRQAAAFRYGQARIVRRIDHVNIVVPKPRQLFEFLTQRFEIPIERPWARFRAFESGQAMLGIGHEPITYAPGRRTAVQADAGLFAIAFEPEPLESARAELARRAIPHSVPFRFAVRYRDEPDALALDESAGPGERRRRWTIVTLGGLLGDEVSARTLSRWPRRGDARGGGVLGGLLGRLASGLLGGVLMARLGSARPFCFLCEFRSFDVSRSRRITADELARRGGGPLGLIRTREIVVSARNVAAQEHRWQQLFDPVKPTGDRSWKLGDGPAIRLIEGTDDGIQELIWEVQSLGRAADWLRTQGWLGPERDEGVSIAAAPLQGLAVGLSDTS
jgi:hypothetical protein